MDNNNSIEQAPEYINGLINNMSEDIREDMPAELIALNEENASKVFDASSKIVDVVLQYKEMLMMYNCAIKEVRTKFEVLNTEYNTRYQRNPIKFINARLKSSTSIIEKLNRKQLPMTIENIRDNINDIAGIRVICSYIDDIYTIAKALVKQDDIELISQKDYIANPKPNGYRSLHIIVRVPVFFAEQTQNIKVEVQIRTIAMDFWASLEHQLKYKKEIENENDIVKRLKRCADVISQTDEEMLDIRKNIELGADEEQSPVESLLEKIKKIDSPLQ